MPQNPFPTYPSVSQETQVTALRQKIGALSYMADDTPVSVSIMDQCWGHSEPLVIVGSDGQVSVSTLVSQLYGLGPQTSLRELRRRLGVPGVTNPAAQLGSEASRQTAAKTFIVLGVIAISTLFIFGMGGAGAFDEPRRRKRRR